MWRTCESCKRVALEAYRDGGNAFLIADGTDFSESQLDYINGTLSVVWRSRAAELEAYRNDRAQERLAAVNLSLGLPEGTRGDTVPSHRYREWSDALDADADAWMAAMPAELRLAPIPPQLPGDVSAYVRNRGEREWVHVDSFHAYPVITQRRRAPKRQTACRAGRYVSDSAGAYDAGCVRHRVKREATPREELQRWHGFRWWRVATPPPPSATSFRHPCSPKTLRCQGGPPYAVGGTTRSLAVHCIQLR